MIFSSYVFVLVFLPIVFGTYSVLLATGRVRLAKWSLVLASLVFYAWGSGDFFPFFVGSVAFNYVVGRMLSEHPNTRTRRRRVLFCFGLLGNIGLLGYYKYTDFVLFNVNTLFGEEIPYKNIVLPIGISFFTFQLIAYLVDSYRGLTRDYELLNYLLFITFFPQLIVGPNHGVVMNLPPVIGAYAALRHLEGLPFSYPGGADWVWEAVDARLLGRACVWAALASTARNEVFNLTNGEVFCWRDLWPALAHTLGVEPGPDDPQRIAGYLGGRAGAWQEVIRRYDLQPIELPDLLGESHHYADLCFNQGRDVSPAPAFVSTVKIRQAGFTEACNTEQSFCHWLEDLQARRILPRF